MRLLDLHKTGETSFSAQVELTHEDLATLGDLDLPTGQVIIAIDVDLLQPLIRRALTNKTGRAQSDFGALVVMRGRKRRG